MGNHHSNHEKREHEDEKESSKQQSAVRISPRAQKGMTITESSTATAPLEPLKASVIVNTDGAGKANNHVAMLSRDVFFVITNFLDARDISRCEQTCRYLYKLCCNEAIWTRQLSKGSLLLLCCLCLFCFVFFFF